MSEKIEPDYYRYYETTTLARKLYLLCGASIDPLIINTDCIYKVSLKKLRDLERKNK